jgi:hypothetical protein
MTAWWRTQSKSNPPRLPDFPANREFRRTRLLSAILKADTRANSKPCSEIPTQPNREFLRRNREFVREKRRNLKATDFRMRFSKSRKEQSTPPAFDHSRDIHAFGICFGHRTHFARGRRPSTLLEMPGDRVRNEPGSNGIHVPVAMPALLMGIKPLRHDHV